MFREAYPATAMALRYPPLKAKLKCNVRRVSAGDFGLQATLVWPEGKAPIEYRTKEWWDDMQRTVSCVRNKVKSLPHIILLSLMKCLFRLR